MVMLSKRLSALARLVPGGRTVADIGTDHGLLPVYLVYTGKAPKVIGTDKNKTPFLNACKKVKSYGLEDKVELRLGDGLEVISPGEVEVIILSGIGGNTIIDILSSAPEVLRYVTDIVLNPADHQKDVRKWLAKENWYFVDEDLVYEQGKFYQIIAVQKRGNNRSKFFQALELEFGPILLEKKPPVLKDYIERKLNEYYKITNNLEKSQRKESKNKLREIKEKVHKLEKIHKSFN